jgi:hypothetical protein
VLGSIEHDLLRPKVVERAIEFAITNGVPAPTPPGGQNSSLRFVDSTWSSPGSPRRSRAVATCQRLLAALKERQAQCERCERVLIEFDATAQMGPARDPAPRTRDP